MARSIAQIQSLMVADIKADPTLSGLTSTSKRAIWNLITFIFATCTFLLESLIDVFTAETEATLAISAAASPLWIQAKMALFQYSPTSSQVIKLSTTTFAPAYPIVDPTLRIITRCSVKTDLANNVLIKLAQQEPPIGLDNLMIASAQSYINTIGGAGITYLVTSGNADNLYINANIYFNGQYRATIQNDVIAAINNYLKTFDTVNFDGTLYLSSIETVMRNVPGVIDVVLLNVSARADTTPYSAATQLIISSAVVSRLWNAISGYLIPETTSGHTLTDSLNFIAQ